MTDIGRRAKTSTAPSRPHRRARRSGWTPWGKFAGVLMLMVGTFHALSGLVALLRDEYYVVRSSGLIVRVDYTAWGWAHLAIGVLVAVAGGAVMTGQPSARAVGVMLAVLSAAANVLFVPAYPLWSMTLLVLDVIVIYALLVHGAEAGGD